MNVLKQEGALEAGELAGRLGVTPMAIRQHLYDLTAEKLVEFAETPRKVGRPAKLWRLTSEANRIFPDAHAELVASVLGAVETAFGPEGMDRLLAERKRKMVLDYRGRLHPAPDPAAPPLGQLENDLRQLARIRDGEGYMAGVEAEAGGTYLLIENHCPICVAATACRGLCAIELDVFQEVLGDGVTVERIDHIQAGARRCAYRVKAV